MPADTVKTLLHAIPHHFPGGQMVFDALPFWIVKSGSGSNGGDTGASFKWALEDLQDIKLRLKQLDLVKETITPHDALGWFAHCGYFPAQQEAS